MWRQQTIKRTQPTIFFSIQSRWCKVKRLVGGLVVDGLVVGGATHTREGWGCWLMQGRWVGSATTDTSVVVVNGWWVVWLILVQGKWVGATTDTMGWVGGAQRFFKGSLSDLFWRSLSDFLRVPEQLSDPLIQGAAHLNAITFLMTLHKEMYPKKHEYSCNFACAHVIHSHVFNVGAIAPGAVLTWHLNEFVGRRWVEWWLIQGRWVGAATTDTRVVVGGLVVLSDFLRVPKRCFY